MNVEHATSKIEWRMKNKLRYYVFTGTIEK